MFRLTFRWLDSTGLTKRDPAPTCEIPVRFGRSCWRIPAIAGSRRNPDSRASPGGEPAKLDSTAVRPPTGTHAAAEEPSALALAGVGKSSPPLHPNEYRVRDQGTNP